MYTDSGSFNFWENVHSKWLPAGHLKKKLYAWVFILSIKPDRAIVYINHLYETIQWASSSIFMFDLFDFERVNRSPPIGVSGGWLGAERPTRLVAQLAATDSDSIVAGGR